MTALSTKWRITWQTNPDWRWESAIRGAKRRRLALSTYV